MPDVSPQDETPIVDKIMTVIATIPDDAERRDAIFEILSAWREALQEFHAGLVDYSGM